MRLARFRLNRQCSHNMSSWSQKDNKSPAPLDSSNNKPLDDFERFFWTLRTTGAGGGVRSRCHRFIIWPDGVKSSGPVFLSLLVLFKVVRLLLLLVLSSHSLLLASSSSSSSASERLCSDGNSLSLTCVPRLSTLDWLRTRSSAARSALSQSSAHRPHLGHCRHPLRWPGTPPTASPRVHHCRFEGVLFFETSEEEEKEAPPRNC